MPRKTKGSAGHSGQTEAGHTRDLKIERIGPVTIYKRGLSYYLYYREGGVSQRRKIDGNLAVARATASKVAAAFAEARPSPLGYHRTSPEELVSGFLDYTANVQGLALRTQDRYRAALDRFVEFARTTHIETADTITEQTVQDLVKWLRGQTRARNGSSKGKRDVYKVGGIKFILSTCRTAFNWAARRRMLPPYAGNPFTNFPIEKLRDRSVDSNEPQVLTRAQEQAFFTACSTWQRGIFVMLATYGLRVGELTHLLVEDIDFEAGSIAIRSKPGLFWSVKTGHRRHLPLVSGTRTLLERLIQDRRAGFAFLNEGFFAGRNRPAFTFASPRAFQAHLEKVATDVAAAQPSASEKEKHRVVTRFCRSMGQIPEKRVREEFMKLTSKIGCPEFTRAHDLRHLFTTRAQEAGINPILVQDMLGHSTLEMTRRYTHLGLDPKREALQAMYQEDSESRTRSNE